MADWYARAAQTGLTHPDGSGDLERFVPSGTWWRPESVDLVMGTIDDESAPLLATSGPWTETRLGRGVLSEFVDLADASDEQILSYARRWGVLELCVEHWHPSSIGHPAGDVAVTPPGFLWDEDAEPVTHSRQACGGVVGSDRIEAVEAWRFHARHMQAALSIAATIKEGVEVPAALWRALGNADPVYPNHPSETLALWLHWNMALCGVSPHIQWLSPDAEPRLELTGGSLYAALALQLSLAVAGSAGYASCSECARLYEVQKKPQAGRRNYCPSCDESGARFRHASRKYYEKKKTGGR